MDAGGGDLLGSRIGLHGQSDLQEEPLMTLLVVPRVLTADMERIIHVHERIGSYGTIRLALTPATP